MPRRKKINPNEPRFFKYINHYEQEVILPEAVAEILHSQMKKFLGDQNGNMTPPEKILQKGEQWRNRTYVNKDGIEMTEQQFKKLMKEKYGGQ